MHSLVTETSDGVTWVDFVAHNNGDAQHAAEAGQLQANAIDDAVLYELFGQWRGLPAYMLHIAVIRPGDMQHAPSHTRESIQRLMASFRIPDAALEIHESQDHTITVKIELASFLAHRETMQERFDEIEQKREGEARSNKLFDQAVKRLLFKDLGRWGSDREGAYRREFKAEELAQLPPRGIYAIKWSMRRILESMSINDAVCEVYPDDHDDQSKHIEVEIPQQSYLYLEHNKERLGINSALRSQ